MTLSTFPWFVTPKFRLKTSLSALWEIWLFSCELAVNGRSSYGMKDGRERHIYEKWYRLLTNFSTSILTNEILTKSLVFNQLTILICGWRQTTNQPTNQPTKQASNQQTNQTTNQPTKKARYQQNNQLTNQTSKPASKQASKQPTNQQNKQATNKTTN